MSIPSYSATIAASTDLVFFRPTTRAQPQALVAQSEKANGLDVVLPATTQAVGRGIGTGSYLHSATPIAASISRDESGVATVTTDVPHGLLVGSHVLVDGASTTPGSGLDPNQWSEFGGTMHEGRQQHTTTLLSDGRIVVTGGISATGAVINSVELFDPITGTWTQGPNMVTARYDHRATLLQDGRVLISGGTTQAGAALSSCEMYDPVANTWAVAPPMVVARSAHVTMLLGNAAVLAVGGNESVTNYEIYQPWTNTWSGTSSALVIGEYATATLLPDFRVLVAGGRVAGVGVTGAYLYNPGTRSWVTAAMPTAVFSHTATSLANGKVLVVGGTANGTAGETSSSLFDPATNTWSAVAPLNFARFAHRAVLLTTGTVLALGGQDTASVTATVEAYDFVSNTWSAVGSLNQARAYAGAVFAPAINKVHAVGGIGATTRLGDVERFPREIGGGGLNGFQTVSTYLSPTQFQYVTPDFPFLSSSSGTITPYAAPANDGVPGPYIYDPNSGIAITGTATKSAQAVAKGSRIRSLPVVDASQFPDEPGYLVLAFGSSVQQAPVRYLGRMSSTALLIDQAYLFTQDFASGADVALLAQKGPWVPENPEQVGSMYATDSNAGRVATLKTIKDTIAAGIKLNIEVAYPLDLGLGAAGWGTVGPKVSDKVWIWDGDKDDASGTDCLTNTSGPAFAGVLRVVASGGIFIGGGGGGSGSSCDLANKPVPPSFSFDFTTGAIGTGPVYCSGPNGTTVDLNTGALLDGNVPLSIPGAGTYIPPGLWWCYTQGVTAVVGIAIYNVPAGFVVSNSMDIVGIANWQGYFVAAGVDTLNPGTWRAICFSGSVWIENAGAVAGNTGCFLIG